MQESDPSVKAVNVPAIFRSIKASERTEWGVLAKPANIGDTIVYVQAGTEQTEPVPDFLIRAVKQAKEL